ncbi:hypothetical protein BGZ73_008142 [Actinomortierella ambigua]|nr:hypothetical protein BGZ73_008142 [Actinomortierella ambigua]
MARPEMYPLSARWDFGVLENTTMWDRFFGGVLPYLGDEEAIAPIVAKHAKHIRCLTIRSRWAFGICEDVCRQLTGFYHEILYHHPDLVTDEERILAFVEQQPNLHSISMPQSTTVVKSLLRLNRNWRHFDVMLEAQDFDSLNDLQSLLPHTRTMQVELLEEGDDSKRLRLSCPHFHLRELELHTDHFDHHMLKDLLESFPNLRRLIVSGSSNQDGLDFVLDNGYSMLVAGWVSSWDIRPMIPLLPNLIAFTGFECAAPVFDVIAQHCPRLMYYHLEKQFDYSTPFTPILLQDCETGMQMLPGTSISRLLASCPDLRSVCCAPWPMSFEDIISAPWVCHKLKKLQCVFSDFPVLSDTELKIFHSLSERRQDRVAANHPQSQSDSEWMSEDERQAWKKAEQLKTYIEAIEAQLQRIPEVDLTPRTHPYMDPRDGSFLEQIEATKASIGF